MLAIATIAKLWALLRCGDCVERALAKADLAAITAMHVNKRWLVRVNAHQGSDFTYLLG